ncbi:DUF302 domain-containing protein [Amycolatopsis rhabdoformis]|uniref:DUF302 domain-containing protein n=1 Tax=Amycolatopsis rhabdoformis TaxID=1448059 RepID=A0ABZ1IH10_9PSEU|nr:DUF302 domain-containing protein [Amycolatopsis rhabdoformis]WSE32725.1 DUF302 domain-containing protein [Amycolatopsis rhabdoformis]
MADDGLVTVASSHPVGETVDRLAQLAEGAGLIVFARIDHAANAEAAGLSLRPMQLLVFGHGKGGTPLLNDAPTSGLDLPLKALAWEDEQGRTHVTYNDAAWLGARHHAGAGVAGVVEALGKGLSTLVSKATE